MGKIPEHAKKVFQGVLFDVYQWEQERFDGSFATFEAVQRLGSVSVIPVVSDKILINDEEQPFRGKFISTPGGICDLGESPEKSAKRELLEETGYSCESLELWYHHDYINPKIQWPEHIFIAKGCEKVQEIELEPGEKISSRLVSFEEFLDIVESKEFRGLTLKELLFRARHTPGELEKFKKRLFE